MTLSDSTEPTIPADRSRPKRFRPAPPRRRRPTWRRRGGALIGLFNTTGCSKPNLERRPVQGEGSSGPRHRRLVDRHVRMRRRLFASRLLGRVFVRQSILRGRRALRAGNAPCARVVTASASEHPSSAASAALRRRPFRAIPGVSCGRLGQARIDRIRVEGSCHGASSRLKVCGELE